VKRKIIKKIPEIGWEKIAQIGDSTSEKGRVGKKTLGCMFWGKQIAKTSLKKTNDELRMVVEKRGGKKETKMVICFSALRTIQQKTSRKKKRRQGRKKEEIPDKERIRQLIAKRVKRGFQT